MRIFKHAASIAFLAGIAGFIGPAHAGQMYNVAVKTNHACFNALWQYPWEKGSTVTHGPITVNLGPHDKGKYIQLPQWPVPVDTWFYFRDCGRGAAKYSKTFHARESALGTPFPNASWLKQFRTDF